MIPFLIRWCLHNRFLVLLFTAAAAGVAWYCLRNTPVDAIPDIGEKQVIVYADWPGRSPQDVEDQVTYPLTVSLEGTPLVKTIRSMSGFGFSMIFVIFRDDADYYWARSRVLERMNVATTKLPPGVVPVLGPDATALGQIFWYTLEADGADLGQLRSLRPAGCVRHPLLLDLGPGNGRSVDRLAHGGGSRPHGRSRRLPYGSRATLAAGREPRLACHPGCLPAAVPLDPEP
ncbi:MAG TPA: efflux RND transporter permease subunit [Gemmataceae bacterium]|nr:efflux RND transporter permease subunit [Gemmataceae bacterium]